MSNQEGQIEDVGSMISLESVQRSAVVSRLSEHFWLESHMLLDFWAPELPVQFQWI